MNKSKSRFINCDLAMLFTGTLIFILTIATLSATPIFAQDKCATALTEAQKMYEAGRFKQAIELLTICPLDSMPKKEQMLFYRVLACSYLAEDYFTEAKQTTKALLRIDPEYKTDSGYDPPQFIKLIDELRNQLENSFTRRISLNFGYSVLHPDDDAEIYDNAAILGVEILFGKKLLAGLSFEYDKFLSQPQDLTGDSSPEILGTFRYKMSGKFYSVVFMYKPYRWFQHRKIIPWGIAKLGWIEREYRTLIQSAGGSEEVGLIIRDDPRFALAAALGVDWALSSFFHPFIGVSYNYANVKFKGIGESEYFLSLKTHWAIQSGLALSF
jgi:hypothetical protein